MTTDCTAAFPSILRERILEANRLLPSLAGNAELHYGGPNTISFIGALAGIDNVNITRGGNTGCAKLPALFTIAVQTALRQVRANHKRVRIVGQMDDHTLLGELDDVIAAFLEMVSVFRTVLGLELNTSKGAVLGGSLLVHPPISLLASRSCGSPGCKASRSEGCPSARPRLSRASSTPSTRNSTRWRPASRMLQRTRTRLLNGMRSSELCPTVWPPASTTSRAQSCLRSSALSPSALMRG